MSTGSETLSRGLNKRHIRFIALGSAIGTGLFYGSSEAIQATGPSVLLAFLIGGAAVFIMMRALGEMTLRHPMTGSFGAYAGKFLGPVWGYLTGWMYVLEMLFIVLADLTAIGIYMKFWFPGVPPWIWVVAVIAIIGGVNLLTVNVFGELEFWLSIIKVGAIIAMIGGGLALLAFGMSTGGHAGMDNLWSQGFFGNGAAGFAACFALVMFSYGGIEIVGVTAAEAKDPSRTIPMAINSVPIRIFLFYVVALAVIMSLQPWTTITADASPFVAIFDNLGVGIAASILNVVVISAAFSAINADIFGAGRMMFGLAERGHAPRQLTKVTRNGVPYVTALVLVATMIVGAVLNAVVPENLFLIIASLVTFATVWVWVMILVSHVVMRRRMAAAGEEPAAFPMPLWPIAPLLTIAFMAFVIIVLAFQADTRVSLIVGLAAVALLAIAYLLTNLSRGRTRETEPSEMDR